MYFKRIFTESIAHFSYIIGDGKELIIIDPQPEIDIYLDISIKEEMKITTILETHRNEDFLTGSKALSDITGAEVYISDHEDLDYQYGQRIKDGHIFNMNNIKLQALHTPGHTLSHMSYVLYYKENTYMVFTGDTCFYGDIGRIDFYGKDRLEEMAGKIYDSIFNRLLPLGDHVIMCPAHGAGSACGENVEERPLTTIGYERKNNPKLQYRSKEKFIKAVSKMRFKPEYFKYMEEMNLIGIDSLDCNPYINIKQIDDIDFNEEYIIDIREQNDYNNAHIPGSIFVKRESISSFINWIIPRKSDLCIISNRSDSLKDVYIDLRRIGYTGRISFLANGMDNWYKNNKVQELEIITPIDYKSREKELYILDVRKESEVDKECGDKGIIIPLEIIIEDYKKIWDKKNIVVVCPTGIRSNIAASFLKSKGIDSKVLIGGLEALE